MASYNIINGIVRNFRFFEYRYWNEDQEQLANKYFIFKVDENDLFDLVFTYWAHIAIWTGGANNEIESQYNINSFETLIYNELSNLKIEDNPPEFGYYNSSLDVLALTWDFPEFKILKRSQSGLLCKDEDDYEFYFDFEASDIFCEEDFQFEDENDNNGSNLSSNPGDPVFMSDVDYNIVKTEIIEKIHVLNNIYSKVKFPYQIQID